MHLTMEEVIAGLGASDQEIENATKGETDMVRHAKKKYEDTLAE